MLLFLESFVSVAFESVEFDIMFIQTHFLLAVRIIRGDRIARNAFKDACFNAGLLCARTVWARTTGCARSSHAFWGELSAYLRVELLLILTEACNGIRIRSTFIS